MSRQTKKSLAGLFHQPALGTSIAVGCGGGALEQPSATHVASVPPSQETTGTYAEPEPDPGPVFAQSDPEPTPTATETEHRDPLAALAPMPPDNKPGRDGSTPDLAIQRCGAGASYAYVAGEYHCPGGGNPLGGYVDAGARARVGNMGGGPDGHVLDLYEVPCPSGAVRIYVDMYHCVPGQSPF